MTTVGSMFRSTLSRAVALTAPLALLAACGTAAVPADSGRHGRQASAKSQPGSAVLAAGTGRARSAIQPARAANQGPGGGATVPGAPNCPMFPASNIWNTDISKLPVNP